MYAREKLKLLLVFGTDEQEAFLSLQLDEKVKVLICMRVSALSRRAEPKELRTLFLICW